MLSDEEAARIEASAPSADRATLARYVSELLSDRRFRSAVILAQSRRLSFARKRLRDTFRRCAPWCSWRALVDARG